MVLIKRDFRGYLLASEDELLTRIAEVSHDLFFFQQELALSSSHETEARLHGYFGENLAQTSHQYREMVAKQTAFVAFKTVTELKGDIAASTVEKEFLELVLERKHPINVNRV